MNVKSHINSFFNAISYYLGKVLIDPGDVWYAFEPVETILLTHPHFDHIYGLNEFMVKFPNARIYTNKIGSEMLINPKLNLSVYQEKSFVFNFPENIVAVEDGEDVDLGGGVRARAVFTPGHNPSCITWVVGDAVFTGDSLIPGIKTVTNLPGGNKELAAESEKIIMELAKARTIYPGHKV